MVEKWEFRLDQANNMRDTTVDRYSWNRKGKMTKIERYLMGTKVLHREHSYNKDGNMTETRLFREGEPNPHMRTAYSYDRKGRKIKAETFVFKANIGETLNEVTTFKYTPDGYLEQEVNIYPSSANDNRKKTFEYNNTGILIGQREYAQSPNDKFDQLLSLEQWEYGPKGELIGHKTAQHVIENEYNEFGNIVKSNQYQRNPAVERTAEARPEDYALQFKDVYTYNKHNVLIEFKRFDLMQGNEQIPY